MSHTINGVRYVAYIAVLTFVFSANVSFASTISNTGGTWGATFSAVSPFSISASTDKRGGLLFFANDGNAITGITDVSIPISKVASQTGGNLYLEEWVLKASTTDPDTYDKDYIIATSSPVAVSSLLNNIYSTSTFSFVPHVPLPTTKTPIGFVIVSYDLVTSGNDEFSFQTTDAPTSAPFYPLMLTPSSNITDHFRDCRILFATCTGVPTNKNMVFIMNTTNEIINDYTYQYIAITSPLDGTQINQATTTINVSYVNPFNYSQISLCIYDPSTLYSLGGINPCEGGGSAYVISASGTLSVNYTGTSTSPYRVFALGFGQSLSYIPSGIRYKDYDKSSIGFFTPAIMTTATGTPESQSKYAGLDCGGFNLSDNIKCAFIFLLYPDTQLLQGFKNLTLASSTPFSYLYQTTPLFTSLTSGGATSTVISFALGNIGINHIGTVIIFDTNTANWESRYSNIVNTARKAVATFLWIAYFYYVVRRLLGFWGYE